MILYSFSTGSGDINTSKVVKADADGCIRGASGCAHEKFHYYLHVNLECLLISLTGPSMVMTFLT